MASSQLSSARCAATTAIAGAKISSTKTTKSLNCGARIGTLATQKVKTTRTSAIWCRALPNGYSSQAAAPQSAAPASTPTCQARKPAQQGRFAAWLVTGEAQRHRDPRHPDEGEQQAPADQHRPRRRIGEHELDQDGADQMPGERGAVEREGAADLVAQQQEAVERPAASGQGATAATMDSRWPGSPRARPASWS